jgi:hypothetical protein
VEVHYACSSQFGKLEGGTTTKKLPPWFLQGSAGSLWTSEAIETPSNSNSNDRVPQKPMPRKPILVAQDAVKPIKVTSSVAPPGGQHIPPRIPITTPKPRQIDRQTQFEDGRESETATIRVEKNQEKQFQSTLDEETATSGNALKRGSRAFITGSIGKLSTLVL